MFEHFAFGCIKHASQTPPQTTLFGNLNGCQRGCSSCLSFRLNSANEFSSFKCSICWIYPPPSNRHTLTFAATFNVSRYSGVVWTVVPSSSHKRRFERIPYLKCSNPCGETGWGVYPKYMLAWKCPCFLSDCQLAALALLGVVLVGFCISSISSYIFSQ